MTPRLIARLDVKNEHLIKGVQLEGLRKLGSPNEYARKYYENGIDEILYMDAVASLYERNSLQDIVSQTVENVFCPVCVGGGIRTVDDVGAMLRTGADKVAVNTAAIRNPGVIDVIASTFGSQCMVLSVEAKRNDSDWECYVDNGREHTSRRVLDWVQEAEDRGAGEILLTSVDQEGTRKGFDINLVGEVADAAAIPVIASGGAGSIDHVSTLFRQTDVSAAAIAYVLHYDALTIEELRSAMLMV